MHFHLEETDSSGQFNNINPPRLASVEIEPPLIEQVAVLEGLMKRNTIVMAIPEHHEVIRRCGVW